MSSNVTIKTLQEIEKKMFQQFHDFCQKEELVYYALGGTFLGAVRHKGFIPWDDDMDVGLPRESYDKLCHLIKNESISNLNFLQSSFQLQIVGDFGAVIDIFALDGVPKELSKQNDLYSWTKKQITRCNIADIENTLKKDRGAIKNILFTLIKWSGISKLFDKNTENQKINNYLRRYSWDNEQYVANVLGRYRKKELVEKRIFGEPTLYPFEDLMIYGPEDAHRYLEHVYGDYMKIPKKFKNSKLYN